jgi:hypothetical protein
MNYSKYLTNRSAGSRSPSGFYDQRQSPQPQFSQTEPTQQYRSPAYNYPGSFRLIYIYHIELSK